MTDGFPSMSSWRRVHLWYEEKFGVRAEPGGRWRVYAPHGLSDVFNLVVRPNPVLAPPEVYQATTERWRRQWARPHRPALACDRVSP